MRRTARGTKAVDGISKARTGAGSRAALGTLTAAGTLLALLLPTGPAGAATPHGSHRSPAPRAALDAFWTADRMRAAAPLDLGAPAKGPGASAARRTAGAVPHGAPMKVPPTLPQVPRLPRVPAALSAGLREDAG
ncbi:peptidase, partial [Streptomyces lydicus]